MVDMSLKKKKTRTEQQTFSFLKATMKIIVDKAALDEGILHLKQNAMSFGLVVINLVKSLINMQ